MSNTNYLLKPVTYGPVVKGTQDSTHMRLWCRIKVEQSLKAKKSVCVISRLKVLGDANYIFADFRYLAAPRRHKYITIFDYQQLSYNTIYEYQIGYLLIDTKTFNGDYFDTAENVVSNFDWSHASYGTFKTGTIEHTSFVFGSCRRWIKIFGTEICGMGASADQVYNAIRSHSPDFFLSIGDQIYLDPLCKNVLQSKSFKDMVKRYDKVRNYDNIKRLMANTCTYEICDDHDHLVNNSNYALRKKYKNIYKNSIKAYFYYQSINGPFAYSKEQHEPLYYNFEREHAAFFVMDTRDERDERSVLSKKIISKKQMSHIEEWLNANASSEKILFLVSPTPLLSQTSQDSWFGYPKQQAKLLQMIEKCSNKNIFILTGDVHCCRVGVYQMFVNKGVQQQEVLCDRLFIEIASSGLASTSHSHGKECKTHKIHNESTTDLLFDVDNYNSNNDFPYELDNIPNGGVKLVTYYAKESIPKRSDKISKGVFTKITIKDNKETMTVEMFNQNNNLLDTCIFNLSV